MDKISAAIVTCAALALPYSVDAQVLTTLPNATTPFTGQEVCYMVQGGVSKQFYCAPPGGSTIGSVVKIVCGPGLNGGTIDSTGTCSLETQEQFVTISFSSVNPAQNSTGTLLIAYRPANAGDKLVLDSIDTITAGTGSPSLTFGTTINGTGVTGCSAISVGTVDTQSTCSAGNTLASGQSWTWAITNVSGTPEPTLQLNYHWVP